MISPESAKPKQSRMRNDSSVLNIISSPNFFPIIDNEVPLSGDVEVM